MNHQMMLPGENKDLLHKIVDFIFSYPLAIVVFVFSMIAKMYIIYLYRRRITPMECFLETTMTGFGSSIIIYVLYSMDLKPWLFCGLGGFSGLVVAPIAIVISKRAAPTAEAIFDKIVEYIRSLKKS